jgi:exopolyphosphatase/guanosine-5'-triphosphate,3'-diphosphate pyrophosphatase
VARYHRRGTPKSSHGDYAGLPESLQRTVRILASILRVAESLDRSHGQVISSLDLHDGGDSIALRIRTQTNSDAELELWATSRHLKPFEKVVKKPVTLELVAAAPLSSRRQDRSLAVGRTVQLK